MATKIALQIDGGKALQRHLETVIKKLGDGAQLRVGFLEGATYPDGTSVPTVAFYNEFGTAKAPPRPFFRNMIASKAPRWGQALGSILKQTNNDAEKSLALMGEGIKDQLVASIVQLSDPPLAAATIAARRARYKSKKGGDSKTLEKPLIDTGVMIRSVDYQVLDGVDDGA